MKTALALITLALVLALAACTKPITTITMNTQEEEPTVEPATDSAHEPELGEIVEDITNPITGARAYEEMQEVKNTVGNYDDLNSRVIVEYKGIKTEMQPSSAIIEFSPDGKYLLYIAGSTPGYEDGTYLYNIETGKTQELIPSMRDTDPRYKPAPEIPTWSGSTITYEAEEKTWALTFDKE